MSMIVTDADKAAFVAGLAVSDAQITAISKLAQGTDEWLASRVGRMTTSNWGAAAGHNKYDPHGEELLKRMLGLSAFKGNAATRYGSEHEDVAAELYTLTAQARVLMNDWSSIAEDVTVADYEAAGAMAGAGASMGADPADYRVEYPGLCVWGEHPWAGGSPDGIIHTASGEVGLLEIKCPFRKLLYGDIPHYYYDQIQGTMGILGLPWCDFVVYTPTKTSVQRFDFDAAYFEGELYPAVHDFYWNRYLPAQILANRGLGVGG